MAFPILTLCIVNYHRAHASQLPCISHVLQKDITVLVFTKCSNFKAYFITYTEPILGMFVLF